MNHPSIDFDNLSVKEISELIDVATLKREEKQAELKRTLFEKWQAEAAEAGLSLESVVASFSGAIKLTPSKTRVKAVVKYRGPSGEEWSGRGRLPNWLRDLEARGKKREDFIPG